jgi:hypothetical protein
MYNPFRISSFLAFRKYLQPLLDNGVKIGEHLIAVGRQVLEPPGLTCEILGDVVGLDRSSHYHRESRKSPIVGSREECIWYRCPILYIGMYGNLGRIAPFFR